MPDVVGKLVSVKELAEIIREIQELRAKGIKVFEGD